MPERPTPEFLTPEHLLPPSLSRFRDASASLAAIAVAFLAVVTAAVLVLGDLDAPRRDLAAEPAREAQLADDLEQLFSSVAESVRGTVVSIGTSSDADADVGAGPGAGSGMGPGVGPGSGIPLESIGSGFVIDPRGYVLTNHHVVGEASSISVRLHDGRHFSARMVASDPSSDIALVKIEAEGLRVLPLGDSRSVRTGQWVLAIGSPYGLSHTVSAGIVSATRRTDLRILPYENFIQTDASINPGNSGGPLVNLRGEAIGINAAMFSHRDGAGQGIGFAIPIDLAKALASHWIAGRHECFLGVYPGRVDADMARYYGLDASRGAFVTHVGSGSPAARAGILPKDLLVSFDGVEVRDENHLRILVANGVPEQAVEVEVLRRDRKERIRVVLREKEGRPIVVEAPAAEPERRTRLLGLTVTPLEEGLAERLGLAADMKGMAVLEVQPSSPAGRKGVQQGDIIVEVDDRPVRALDDLKGVLAGTGDILMLGVIRGGGTEVSYYFVAR